MNYYSRAQNIPDSSNCFRNCLVITGTEETPFVIRKGYDSQLYDLATMHEEADLIIVQQVIHAATITNTFKVVCDDTDVFALLVHFYHKLNLGANHCLMLMEARSGERNLVDIGKTIEQNSEIVPCLLTAQDVILWPNHSALGQQSMSSKKVSNLTN